MVPLALFPGWKDKEEWGKKKKRLGGKEGVGERERNLLYRSEFGF